MTSDPIGLNGGLNTFWYAGGNPLKYFDPFGLATQEEIDIAMDLIFSNFPEIFTIKPNSITPVKDVN